LIERVKATPEGAGRRRDPHSRRARIPLARAAPEGGLVVDRAVVDGLETIRGRNT